MAFRIFCCSIVVALSVSATSAFATEATTCPSYPPVLLISGNAIYKDEAGSVTDTDGAAKNRELLAPVDDFLTYLGRNLDESAGTADLACSYGLMRQWATAGALLQPPETAGRVARVWIVPAFEFIALKFKMRNVPITPDVARWLSALAAVERGDYGKPLTKGSYAGSYSNVYPWVGAANALSALISGDPEAMRFQNEVWHNMLAEIRPDGTIQSELNRKAQALEYHQKAANGLLILHAARRALGQPDDPAQIARLKLLLDMIGNAFCDPQSLAAAAGAKLNIPGEWNFRIPYAFDEGLLPETWTTCGPKGINWGQAEYSGGDARISAGAVKLASPH